MSYSPAVSPPFEYGAFANCTGLTGVFFVGDAPTLGSDVFSGDDSATVYYLPGTTGWGPTFGGLTTKMLNQRVPPRVEASHASFGVRTNRFGFTITGTNDLVVVVEACTNLVNPIWSPLQTIGLTGGSYYFSDPQWTNYLVRFYRCRLP